jgi:CBS domain-containing protein
VLRKLAQSFGFARIELAMLPHEPSRTAHDVMSQPVVTAGPDDRLEEVVRLMVERGVKFLPIVDEQGRLLGAIRRAEVLQAISKHLAEDN